MLASVGSDQGRQFVDKLRRQVVPHPLDDFELRPRNVSCRVDPVLNGNERVSATVDDQRGLIQSLESPDTAPATDDRGKLALKPLWVITAFQRCTDLFPQFFIASRVARAADQSQ